MACVLIQRTADPSNANYQEKYYLSGTGWQGSESAATQYASKEASMSDGIALREQLGQGARLTVKDLVTGEEHPIPVLT